MSDVSHELNRIQDFFNRFNFENLHLLNEFYHPDVHFIDPMGEIRGLEKLGAYYAKLYKNLKSIRFDFSESFQNGDSLMFVWTMTMEHSALGRGQAIVLEGASLVKLDPATKQILFHRDFFDLGQMLYEKITGLGPLVRFVKKLAAGH